MSDPPETKPETKTPVGKIEPLQRPASVETIHKTKGTSSISDNRKSEQRSSLNRFAFMRGSNLFLLEGSPEFIHGALFRLALVTALALLCLAVISPGILKSLVH